MGSIHLKKGKFAKRKEEKEELGKKRSRR